MAKKKNVYMGKDSVAKIPPIFGKNKNKVDHALDILINAYATAYDILDKKLLTHYEGRIKPLDIHVILGRFQVLEQLALRFSPNILPSIEELKNYALSYANNQIDRNTYLFLIRNWALRNIGNPQLIQTIETKIKQAQR